MSRKAFTLIELLVVIAIIAILAAILFPVFAQAKQAAKKTSALSAVKQYGTSTNIYLADTDDVMPLAFATRPAPTNTWGFNVITPYPEGWFDDGTWGSPGRINMAACAASNSIQPYMKSYGLGEIAGYGKKQWNAPDFTATRLKAPQTVGLNFNGILMQMNSSAINSPSVCPLWSSLQGNNNSEGREIANPVLRCDGPPVAGVPVDCRYNASSTPFGTSAGFGGTWLWPNSTAATPPAAPAQLYNGGIVVSRVDSSAKFYKITSSGFGTDAAPIHNQNILEPWAYYWSDGTARGIRQCDVNGSGTVYPCFFHPEQDGTRSRWNTIYE